MHIIEDFLGYFKSIDGSRPPSVKGQMHENLTNFFLGHTQVSTTMDRYTHVSSKWQEGAAQAMAKGLWGLD